MLKSHCRLILPLFATTLLFASCGGSEASDNQGKVAITAEENIQNSEEQDYVLPQPISLAQAFKNAGLLYVPGKTNPVSKKESYSKKIDQLLNLGIYSTDLAYCAINNKTQEARDYLAAVQYLGSKVGLESIFSDKAIIEKFDKNLGNADALEELIYDLQDRSDSYFAENDLRQLAAVEFAGAWIEGMYIGSDPAANKKEDINFAVVEQMTLLSNTIKGLKSQKSDDVRLNEIIKGFESILNTYNAFPSVVAANKNVNYEVPKLNPANFLALAEKITVVRQGIVSPAQK